MPTLGKVGDENSGPGAMWATSTGPAPATEGEGESPRQRQYGRRPPPPPLPLHERSPSQNNRQSGIRVVPYSPPRLAADGVDAAALPSGTWSTASTSSPRRRPLPESDDETEMYEMQKGESDDNDNDETALHGAGKRSLERVNRSSRGSRASWGSLLAAAAAGLTSTASSPTRAPSSAGSRASRGSWGSRASKSRASKSKASRGQKAGNSGKRPSHLSHLSNLSHLPLSLDRPGSALSSDGDSSAPLANQSARTVSGTKLASPTDRHWPLDATSYTPLNRAVNTTGRNADGSRDGSESAVSAVSAVSALADSLDADAPPLASPTLLPASAPSLRPNSRRHNHIAVHSNKTFSLVPRVSASSFSSSAASASASASASPSPSLVDPLAQRRSPRPSFSSTTAPSSFSHERLSDALSADLSSSSPLTTNATVPDRSSLSPSAYTYSTSPELSSATFRDKGKGQLARVTASTAAIHSSIASTTHPVPPPLFDTPALRKVPSTPDLKQKGKARALSPVRPIRPVTPKTPRSPRSPKTPRTRSLYPSGATVLSAASTSTITLLPPSVESTPTAVRAAPPLPPPPPPPPVVAAPVLPVPVTPENPLKKTSSFASDSESSLSFAPSTVSATTNYKVYARSSSPVLQADSFVSDAASFDLGNTTNIEILGRSSSPAPLLPSLPSLPSRPSLPSQPSLASLPGPFDHDPDQTFSTLASSAFGESSPNVVVLGVSSSPPPAALAALAARRARSPSFATDDDNAFSSSPPARPRTNETLHTVDSDDSLPNYVLHRLPQQPLQPLRPLQSLPSQPPSSLPPSSQASSSSSLVPSRSLRPTYSQESLIVPPLQPARKRSLERFGYYRQRSRESLRHASSIKSIASVILNQEAASTFFAGQAFLNITTPPVPVFSTPPRNAKYLKRPKSVSPPLSITTTIPKRKPVPLLPPPIENKELERTPVKKRTGPVDAWESLSPAPSSPRPSPSPRLSPRSSPRSSPVLPQQSFLSVPMAEEHPHQWSSQLSTVMSESEEESVLSSRVVSRPVSQVSGTASAASNRRSSGRVGSNSIRSNSLHSRNMPSISSSLALQLDEARSRHSRSDSMLLLERAQQGLVVRHPNSSTSPSSGSQMGSQITPVRPAIVRDVDEHGDGLVDLQDMHDALMRQQPQASRSALSGFFATSSSSSRNLHSSASSRSLASAIPAWARVYYGSGERKRLAASVSEMSLSDDYPVDSRPSSRFRRSPSVDNMPPLHVFHTRRRPRQVHPGAAGTADERPFSDAASIEAGEAGPPGQSGPGGYSDNNNNTLAVPRGLRQMASSVWSPHLRADRRATRFSMWDPPSVTWSAETNSLLDRRNMQIIAFTVGFILPFAWMIAAFLPLPLDPQRAMEKRPEGEFGVPDALKRRMAQVDEVRFQSARWWRTLNRVMSVVGLLVLGAVVALIVIAVREGWANK